ncbi:Hypothetical predicted protein [Mytilus galloprovincialis]|uniref:Uncharacterized protein n=1 Tax=Mytilus galloprovincialis TaxID=29158 RepID=A0A8B6G6T3_MYTGA|nr:Hypothetical predicted protein [Mytilus galloprovincialis]
MNNNPCEGKLGKVTIQTSVPLITTKDEQTSNVKNTLAISMLEEEYPLETLTEDRTQQFQPTPTQSHESCSISNVFLWRSRSGYGTPLTVVLDPSLRDNICHSETLLKEKLYGPVGALQETTRFVEETSIQV